MPAITFTEEKTFILASIVIGYLLFLIRVRGSSQIINHG